MNARGLLILKEVWIFIFPFSRNSHIFTIKQDFWQSSTQHLEYIPNSKTAADSGAILSLYAHSGTDHSFPTKGSHVEVSPQESY